MNINYWNTKPSAPVLERAANYIYSSYGWIPNSFGGIWFLGGKDEERHHFKISDLITAAAEVLVEAELENKC